MSKKSLFLASGLACASLMLLGTHGQAMAQSCSAPEVQPEVQIVDATTPVNYDFTKTARQIQQIGGPAEPNQIERGLTLTNLTTNYESEMHQISDPGSACVFPKTVTITVSYRTDVYVQSEYPRGSCQSEAILLHENTHVSNAWSTLRDRIPLMKMAVQQALDGYVASAPTVEEGRKMVMDRITAAMHQQQEEQESDRVYLDHLLDSGPSIQKTLNSCSRW